MIIVLFAIFITLIVPFLIVVFWRKPRLRAFGVALAVHIATIMTLAFIGGGTELSTLLIGAPLIGLIFGGPVLFLLNLFTRRKPDALTQEDINKTFG